MELRESLLSPGRRADSNRRAPDGWVVVVATGQRLVISLQASRAAWAAPKTPITLAALVRSPIR